MKTTQPILRSNSSWVGGAVRTSGALSTWPFVLGLVFLTAFFAAIASALVPDISAQTNQELHGRVAVPYQYAQPAHNSCREKETIIVRVLVREKECQ